MVVIETDRCAMESVVCVLSIYPCFLPAELLPIALRMCQMHER